jgi:hypothetical protein
MLLIQFLSPGKTNQNFYRYRTTSKEYAILPSSPKFSRSLPLLAQANDMYYVHTSSVQTLELFT